MRRLLALTAFAYLLNASSPALAQDRAPVVTAPATRFACENTLLTFTVGAIDPDGDAIASLTASGTAMTAGAAFTAGVGNTSGTLSWTPTFTNAGAYSATFTAQNALSGSAATAISVGGCDRPPVVTAPATASGTEGSLLTFTVTAADADGQAITTFTASGTAIAAGATFTTNASKTSGTFNWTPNSTQAGTYSATFFAANAFSGSATTNITIADGDHAPMVTAPPVQTACPGFPFTFTIAASDPDGDAIASLTATGTAITAGGTFTSGLGNTSGTFSWTPALSGSFYATFTASNALSGSASTAISVGCGVLPFVDVPATVSGPEGSPITFTVTASEADGPAIVSLTASGTAITAGATFTAGAPSPGGSSISGAFDWTPDFTQAGTYSVTFTATSNFPGTASTNIIVTDCNRGPALSAPSHVAAAVGVPVSFIVGAATCGGESLTLTGSGLPPGSDFIVSPSQTTGTFTWTPGSDQAGTWPVTFTATVDGGSLSNSAATVIDVAPPLVARAFTVNSYRTIRVGSEKASWCASVEAIGGSFSVSDIVRTSVVLMSPGTGSVPQISANAGKFLVVGDADKNDVEDATLCFRKEDLRLLFSDVSGRTTVNVTLAGSLTSGRNFSAALSVDVVGGGGNLAASVTPNPLNPSGILSFVSTRSGSASIRIFSQTGRLVRTLKEGTLPEGRHEVRIDGRDEGGRPLATGIYFYRVDLAEGTATGRFAILK